MSVNANPPATTIVARIARSAAAVDQVGIQGVLPGVNRPEPLKPRRRWTVGRVRHGVSVLSRFSPSPVRDTGTVSPGRPTGGLGRRPVRVGAGVRVAAVGVTVAVCAITGSAASAAPSDGIHNIKHVVMIMQENRSFDSYFGTYPGATGIPAGTCVPDPRQRRLRETVPRVHRQELRRRPRDTRGGPRHRRRAAWTASSATSSRK